jgi:hypothetical protein
VVSIHSWKHKLYDSWLLITFARSNVRRTIHFGIDKLALSQNEAVEVMNDSLQRQALQFPAAERARTYVAASVILENLSGIDKLTLFYDVAGEVSSPKKFVKNILH